MTAAALKEYTLRDLAQMAKRRGIRGWHSMRKDELVRALVRAAKSKSPPSNGSKAGRAGKAGTKTKSLAGNGAARKAGTTKHRAKATNGRESDKPVAAKQQTRMSAVARRIHRDRAVREKQRDLATVRVKGQKNNSEDFTDRVVLLVRDAYWLQVHWRFTRQTVSRAQAALAEHWHTARPILRLLEVNGGTTTSTAERVVRDIEIHGGVNNWYVDVKDSPKSYRIDVGYRAATGRFFSLGKSNTVTTPRPGDCDVLDEDWSKLADDYDRIYAMSGGLNETNQRSDLRELFEEQLRRPMGAPAPTRYGAGASRMIRKDRDFTFEVEADVIIFGQAKPDSYVTLAGEPVKLRPDGTFMVRMAMPDQRQILPVIAQSSDGIEQRTTVLSINRNTKHMEPVIRDPSE
jgi:hypothetical protein